MRRELFFGMLSGVLSISVAFAQTTTTTPTAATPATTSTTTAPTTTGAPATTGLVVTTPPQPTALLATTTPVTAAELGVAPRPGFFSLLGLRLQRVFALGDIAKARVTEQLARTLLQQARIAAAQGDTARAQSLLTQYNAETSRASQLISGALTQVNLKTNPAAQALVTQIEEGKILEAAVVDEMRLKATGEFNKRLIKERAEIAKKLVKLLTKEDLTPAELEQKIAKLVAKLAEKEAKAETKLAKRLAALNLIDEAADEDEELGEPDELNEEDEDELDQAVGAAEQGVIAEAAVLPAANLGQLVSQIPGSTSKHLVVLQALLDRVPEAAKSTIEQVLTKELEKAKAKLGAKQAELGELVDEGSVKHKVAKEKLLAKLQEKADDRITKAIEKSTKQLQKAEERRAKLLEKQAKQQDSDEEEVDEDEDDDDQATSTVSPSPTATSSLSDRSTPTATPEPKTHKIELENDGFNTTSLTINVGDSVTFEIKDEGSYQVRSGPHPTHTDIPELDSGVVAKGAKYTFKFSKAGGFRFHDHLHPSFTGTITVK
ncbi:MAG: cupredoxin domain-containing protein [Patescibacteria group bacterium]